MVGNASPTYVCICVEKLEEEASCVNWILKIETKSILVCLFMLSVEPASTNYWTDPGVLINLFAIWYKYWAKHYRDCEWSLDLMSRIRRLLETIF